MISVIVPVYKSEKYLPRCVDSILAQSYTDIELLLVNDGSPDNCGAICDEYAAKDNRVRVFHKENGGVSSARNLGLNNAQGEWITFVDSDDWIESDFFEIHMEVSEDLLVQNYRIQEGDNCIPFVFEKRSVSELEIQDLINETIDKQIFRVPWAKFFKRKLIINNNIYFAEGVKIGEDTLFVLDYLRYVKSVRFLSGANYVYREEGRDYDKYKLTVSKSLEIVHLFIQKYNQLNANSTSFLDFVFAYYQYLIYPQDYISLVKWRSDKVVIDICKVIKKDYGLKWAIKRALYLMKERVLDI